LDRYRDRYRGSPTLDVLDDSLPPYDPYLTLTHEFSKFLGGKFENLRNSCGGDLSQLLN